MLVVVVELVFLFSVLDVLDVLGVLLGVLLDDVLDDVLDDDALDVVGASFVVGTLLPQQCSSTIMPKTRKHREDRLATRS
jgi:hypothetical protein